MDIWGFLQRHFRISRFCFVGDKFEKYKNLNPYPIVPAVVMKSQWIRATKRINRLLSKGHRMRGDVLAV